MRYRVTICVDLFEDSMEDAEKKAYDLVSSLPNSFQIALSRMPHGSDISLTQERSDTIV